VLRELNQILRATVNGEQKESEALGDQSAHGSEITPGVSPGKRRAIKPQLVVKRLYELTQGRDPIVWTDRGQHQNVGCTVLQAGEAKPVVDLRWSWDDGLWDSRGHGRAGRLPDRLSSASPGRQYPMNMQECDGGGQQSCR